MPEMPTPEVVVHSNASLTIVGTAVTTAVPIIATAFVGFVKLRTEVRLYRDENTKEHKTIFRKLDDQNGRSRKNETAITRRAAVCEERHG